MRKYIRIINLTYTDKFQIFLKILQNNVKIKLFFHCIPSLFWL